LSGCVSLSTNFNWIPSNAWPLPEQTLLGQITLKTAHAAAAAGRVKTSSLADSGFYLLDSDAVAFATRLTLVEAAQKTIDIQYYAIHADETTDQLFDALKLAASRGVRVRILLDDFITCRKNIQVLSLAYVPGIELRLFNPWPGSRNAKIGRVLGALYNAQAFQRRMHNKMMAADSAMAIAGGRNLGETYFGQGAETNFIDFVVLSAARIVRELSPSFDRFRTTHWPIRHRRC
jgi:phosphatidylserine/phosphatidylglycerophosphate/cardiolipin synthase-like enzyme